MFDFAWSEIALVGVVALVAIGPKDMPVAIKAMAGLVKKARRMAGEFQGHVEDLIKEADLTDVKRDFGALRSFNLRDTVAKSIDPDGTLRATLAERPLQPQAGAVLPSDHIGAFVGEHPSTMVDEAIPSGRSIYPPAFGSGGFGIPPEARRPDLAEVPAFIPPGAVASERERSAAPAFVPPADAARGLPAPDRAG